MRRIALLVVLLMLMSVGGLATADESATVGPIYPWWAKWNETTVNVGDTVLLGARWGACTEGITWSARNAIDFQYWIRPVGGGEDDWVKIHPEWDWQKPVPTPSEEGAWPSAEGCVTPTEHIWYMLAAYPYVFTEDGDYEVQTLHMLTRQITDLIDDDGDGRSDKIDPTDGWLFLATGTVHVVGGP